MPLPKPDQEPPSLSPHRARELDDRLLRLVGIPFFGIAIPNFTGLFGPLTAADALYWLGYPYFIVIAFVIWQGNRWLLFRQREHHDWFSDPLRKLINLVAANVFYTAPVTVLLIWGWYGLAALPVDWPAVRVVALVNVICVLFVTHVYETVFLIKERQSDALAYARLEQARAQAELAALKNQIDPHFMFNSLNTLSHLIETDPGRALVFNDRLADVYRYILTNKDRTLIPLREELDFLHSYFTLLRLRFEGGIELCGPATDTAGQYLLPPISLQVLMENAVKHNEFDVRRPLRMTLEIGEDRIRFANPRYPRRSKRPATGTGLKNLNERYRLVTGREIVVDAGGEWFRVDIPLLKTVI